MSEHLAFRVVTVCLLVLLCVNAGAVAWTLEKNGSLRRALVQSCERGNTLRVGLNILLAEHDEDVPPLEIIDCEKAIP